MIYDLFAYYRTFQVYKKRSTESWDVQEPMSFNKMIQLKKQVGSGIRALNEFGKVITKNKKIEKPDTRNEKLAEESKDESFEENWDDSSVDEDYNEKSKQNDVSAHNTKFLEYYNQVQRPIHVKTYKKHDSKPSSRFNEAFNYK